MHTSFARTLQMLICIYLGFAIHNMHTHASTKKHIHAHTCTPVFKFRATERLESLLHGQSKSHVIERSNLYYAGFS